MKMKTNKLLTLTLATGLVAMTAGCGASKTPAASGGNTGGGGGTGPTVTDTVAYSDWTSGATQVTATAENGFVAGNAASIALTPALTGVESLNLRSEVAPVNGTVSAITLGGDAVDGVAFASNGTTTELRYFAALHSGTDLGAPVPTTGASATWENGLFQAVGAAGTYATASKTFALTVTFGTTDAARTITGLVGANTNADAFTATGTSYYISGTYDAAGVITGNVLYRDFSAAADDAAARLAAAGLLTTATGDTPTDPQTVGLGVLSGLIGAQGAVGAFHSSGSDGDGVTGFAGGFVVSALANLGGVDSNAVYADWSGSDDVTLATTLEDNGFLASVTADADGLDVPTQTPAITPAFTTLNLNSPTHAQVDAQPGVAGTGPRTLGGAATNGVAFFSNPGTTPATDARYFAGLHFGTDLGAPITLTTGSAEWNGLIQTISGTPAAQFDAKLFRLSVNFVNSEVSAHVTTDTADTNFGIASYYLTGEYDDAGVITGTVSYSIIANTPEGRTAATGNGTLSGLISATGAVGAFHSTADGAAGYAGGFVARSTAIPAGAVITALPVVDYADWTAGATQATALGTANGFLAGTATSITLLPTGVTAASVRDGSSTGAITGGVSFFNNPGTTPATDARYYAGLHTDTNLGAPIPLTTANTAMWSGMFETVSGTTGQQVAEKAITLAVTFGATPTITGSVAVGSGAVDGMPAYHINGQYDAAGVITGFVAYSADATDGATGVGLAITGGGAGTGTLTGLIGASGAVGAFHSSGSDGNGATGYAGGFYVKP